MTHFEHLFEDNFKGSFRGFFRILDQRKKDRFGRFGRLVIYPVATYSEIGGDPKVNLHLPEDMWKEKF